MKFKRSYLKRFKSWLSSIVLINGKSLNLNSKKLEFILYISLITRDFLQLKQNTILDKKRRVN